MSSAGTRDGAIVAVWQAPTHSALASSSPTTSQEKSTTCMPQAPNQEATLVANQPKPGEEVGGATP